jgi:hypothetical protein
MVAEVPAFFDLRSARGMAVPGGRDDLYRKVDMIPTPQGMPKSNQMVNRHFMICKKST